MRSTDSKLTNYQIIVYIQFLAFQKDLKKKKKRRAILTYSSSDTIIQQIEHFLDQNENSNITYVKYWFYCFMTYCLIECSKES